MTLPLTPEELKQYNNVPTTPLSQKLGDTIDELVAGNAYQVDDMAARNALTPTDRQVVRVKSTGELFVYDASATQWRVVPNSSTRPDFFQSIDSFTDSITIWVDPTGSDVDGEGTQAAPFGSVARALNSIPTGFFAIVAIAVASGSYPDREWFAPSPGPRPSGTSSFGSPMIYVFGQGALSGEVITLSSGNLAASTVPHPSGLGNYASFRDFNSFPTWSTPIPGTFPTVHPVPQQGTAPEYLLVNGSFLNSGAFSPSTPYVVLPGSDNTTGKMRLLNTSLFFTGDYYLMPKSALPEFPQLSKVYSPKTDTSPVSGFFNCSGIRISRPSFDLVNVAISGSFLESSFRSDAKSCSIYGCVIINPLRISGDTLNGVGNCYIQSGYLKFDYGACAFVDRMIFDTTPTAGPKLVVGGIFESNAAASGDSASISYTGYVDMIGDGVGIRLGSASVSPYNDYTFDGVSNPLLMNSGSNWGRRGGSALGTCTAPTIIGVNSSTGAADAANPGGTGIATWNVQNTATPGQEVQVGGNPVTTYASLPQTDFALGNTSLGAIGR